MADRLPALSATRYADLCRDFVKKITTFVAESQASPAAKVPNRVELKKTLLNATRGRSLATFVQYLGSGAKQHFKTMMHMECPVLCPNRKVMLPPVESMPCNVMKSAKKLRNFFGIPEAQICRGCIKRVRCRRFQEIERDVPDLSDLAAVFIGVYSTCKINLQGSELVVAEASLKELPSILAVLDALVEYCREHPHVSECPRGDERACKLALQKRMKAKEMRKMEMLKQKVFNIPENFNALPAEHTYMTGFQRELFNKLSKGGAKKKEEEKDELWVADAGDSTLEDDGSDELVGGLHRLNRVPLVKAQEAPSAESEAHTGHIQELDPAAVQFRMQYSKPIGSDVTIVRYDIANERFIQGIKVNTKGRVVIDLDKHVAKAQRDELDAVQGLEMYRPVSAHKAANYAEFLKNIPSHANSLAFLKRVAYSYQCQSSGETRQPSQRTAQEEAEALRDVAMALEAQTNG